MSSLPLNYLKNFKMNILIRKTQKDDKQFARLLSEMYEESAKVRKTGIATRSPEYITTKIQNEDAIIALDENRLVGFCYIETFTKASYVSNSGLIVDTKYRGLGLAKAIKKAVFNLARDKYPDARVFGITTSPIVMNINIGLGYRPAPFSDLTEDDLFWNGCKTCVNYDVLMRNDKRLCLCTGMIAPSKNSLKNKTHEK
jgi:GNAT superfamily N-acetyltransferase